MEKKQEIPTGLDHLAMVRMSAMYVADETTKNLDEFKANNDLIGTALNVIYQAATCHCECHGGAHVLERLCGRAYNLGCAAYNLTVFGLYDEALNLVRGIGELTNLVMLSALDPPKIQEWLHTDRDGRLKEFSPSKVRRMVKSKGVAPCATDTWYREMSEDYTHITPNTQPNFHGGVAFVGGKYSSEGMEKCFGALLFVLTMLAMFVTRFFKYDDLFAEISSKLRIVSGTSTV